MTPSSPPRSLTARAQRAVSRVAAAADRADRARWAAGGGGGAGRLAGAWASTKVVTTAVLSPVLGAGVAAAAARNTAVTRVVIDHYPRRIEQVLRGERAGAGFDRVARVPSAGRWFVSSDLHRCVAGSTDWPTQQNVRGLYEAALDHYGAGGWGLVENGDVEDFWLVGGSTYGTVYDLVRLLAAVVPGRAGDDLRVHLCGEHIRRIVDNNRGIYERIDDLFHRPGRYCRVVGNHDDYYLDDRVVDHLREVHAGLAMYDAVVFDGPRGPVGLATHGHHTDAWNAPWRANLGRLGTWLASAVTDAPFLDLNPGRPTPAESVRIVGGMQPDELTVVSPTFGANRHLYSVDEVLLFRAVTDHFGVERMPWLLLGHTHLPVRAPWVPGDPADVWARYANSGSGVHHELITGLEWDGRGDPGQPEVRLVAWHYADAVETPAEAVVAHHDGRPVARQVLEPDPEHGTLRPVPLGAGVS